MAVRGFNDSPLIHDEVNKAQEFIQSSLEAGAMSVTLGLVYSPETYYDVDCLAEVLKPMSDFDVPLVTHVRGEGNILHDSLREVIEVARRLGVQLNVSHFKMVGKNNYGTGLQKAMDILQEARDSGMTITCDVYPYTARASQMIQYLPPIYQQGGAKEIVKRLSDPIMRKELIKMLRKPQTTFANLLLGTGWDKTIIVSVNKPENQKYVGKTVTQMVEELGKDSAVIRTFSKGLGAAGIRLGYVLGNKDFIYMMSKVNTPFANNSISPNIASQIINSGWNKECGTGINADKKRILKELSKLKIAYTSENMPISMLYCDNKQVDLCRLMEKTGLKVVSCEGYKGLRKNSIRLNLHKNMELLMECLRETEKLL